MYPMNYIRDNFSGHKLSVRYILFNRGDLGRIRTGLQRSFFTVNDVPDAQYAYSVNRVRQYPDIRSDFSANLVVFDALGFVLSPLRDVVTAIRDSGWAVVYNPGGHIAELARRIDEIQEADPNISITDTFVSAIYDLNYQTLSAPVDIEESPPADSAESAKSPDASESDDIEIASINLEGGGIVSSRVVSLPDDRGHVIEIPDDGTLADEGEDYISEDDTTDDTEDIESTDDTGTTDDDTDTEDFK